VQNFSFEFSRQKLCSLEIKKLCQLGKNERRFLECSFPSWLESNTAVAKAAQQLSVQIRRGKTEVSARG